MQVGAKIASRAAQATGAPSWPGDCPDGKVRLSTTKQTYARAVFGPVQRVLRSS